jgi:hypothetical protein
MTHPTILLLLRVFVAAGTCLPGRCLATLGVIHRLMGRFMKYVAEIGSGVMIYIRSFIKTGSAI